MTDVNSKQGGRQVSEADFCSASEASLCYDLR